MTIPRIIHRRNPYRASEAADVAGRGADKKRTEYFAEREVQNPDGSFPFGEGFLYAREPRGRDPSWASGTGRPGTTETHGHRGSKRQQQDAFGAVRFQAGNTEAAAIIVADGVSGSGDLAKPASNTAVRVFLERVQVELASLPAGEAKRNVFVEEAFKRAAFAANFEVVRQVLFDEVGKPGYDGWDRNRLRREHGIELPTGALTLAQMQRLAPRLDSVVASAEIDEARSALTTFAAAIAIDNDLFTFSTGDAVIGLFRPGEPAGKRFVHLTHRDQVVVGLFREGGRPDDEAYENVITESFGAQATLRGTLRRYSNLLEPGDRVIAASDGLGPRGGGEGAERDDVGDVLMNDGGARDLIEAQLEGLERGEYQDNIGVAVLNVE